MLLHFWTRFDGQGPNRGVSQDRVELTAAEWRAVVPAAEVRPGASWAVPEKLAHKLFQYCYPPGPHWNARDCKVLGGGLRATVLSVSEAERGPADGEAGTGFSVQLETPMTGRTQARPDRSTARLTGVVPTARRGESSRPG